MYSIDQLQNRRQPLWRRIGRELGSIALLVLVVLAARSALADHYHVPSASMEPTLMAGDRVLVDKMAYGLRIPFTQYRLMNRADVVPGDVVIFDSPRDGKRLIKRVVAIGGETVEIRDGHVQVDGRSMTVAGDQGAERLGDRIIRLNLGNGGGPDYVQTIPGGMLLAVGDHRGNSLDGRIFGLITEGSVYGKAKAVYYRSGEGFVWKTL